MANEPKAAKGSKRSIEVSCVAWIDLLGYGSMLEASSFDLVNDVTKQAVERIHKFHEIVSSHSCRYLPTFVMNDGAVVYRDMSPRSRSVTYDFLKRSIDLYAKINETDINQCGFPGARMVVAAGFRARRKMQNCQHLATKFAVTLKNKIDLGEISVDQAISQALSFRKPSDVVPELQSNFAFTKAYLADNAGSKAGLGGPSCYVDLSIFTKELPLWIDFDETINLSLKGMNCTFGKLKSIDHISAGKVQHNGILDSFGIAENISKVVNPSTTLKKMRVKYNTR